VKGKEIEEEERKKESFGFFKAGGGKSEGGVGLCSPAKDKKAGQSGKRKFGAKKTFLTERVTAAEIPALGTKTEPPESVRKKVQVTKEKAQVFSRAQRRNVGGKTTALRAKGAKERQSGLGGRVNRHRNREGGKMSKQTLTTKTIGNKKNIEKKGKKGIMDLKNEESREKRMEVALLTQKKRVRKVTNITLKLGGPRNDG